MTAHPLLHIDSQEVPLSQVWVHTQNVPRPGGHHFTLYIPDEYLGDLVAEVNDGDMDVNALNVLMVVKWEIGNWLQKLSIEQERSRYVLNRATKVQRTKDGIVLTGICSPVVTRVE